MSNYSHICKECGITFENDYKTANLCDNCFNEFIKNQPADNN